MWNYAPMQFDDYSIIYIVQEPDAPAGGPVERVMDEAVKVWNDPDRPPEWLGRARARPHVHARAPGMVASSVLWFPDAPGGPLEVAVTPLSTATSASAPATASTPTGSTAPGRGRSSCRA